jgi:phosphatidate cytidylyltransferase
VDESHERDDRLSHRQQAEGVRIIRAEEAQAALEAGQASGRRPDDAPRFGDVPPPPEGPRSPHRFPLPESVDPASAVPRSPVRPPERRSGRFGGRPKAPEPVRAPTPPRVVRLLGGTTAEAPTDVAVAPEGATGGDAGSWTDETVPRGSSGQPMPVGAAAEGPKHFARRGDTDDGGAGATADSPYAGWSAAAGAPGAPDPGSWSAPPPPGGDYGDSAPAGPVDSYRDDFGAGDDDDAPPPSLAPPEEGINLHSGSMPALQHWTDPPTGEIPFVLPDREPSQGEELAAWQALGTRGLRWRDEASDWDDLDDVSQLGSDEPRLGALDTTRTEHSDMFSFDEQFERLDNERLAAPAASPPVLDEPPVPPPPQRRVSRPSSRVPNGGARHDRQRRGGGGGGGRDLKSAATVGVGLVVILAVAYVIGAAALVVLSTVVVTAAALELYNAMQHRGFRPATLLGVCATVAVMLASYGRWGPAVPLIVVLVAVTSMLWYMFGVVDARPVVNIGLTVMGFVWVGVFGSYASLLLSAHHGKQLLLLPILVTVGADIAAYFAGSSIGSRPLAPTISPGKTWEGVIAGGVGAIVISFILSRLPFLHNTWTAGHAILLGVVVAIVAPIGDLCESMVKRDLDLKDSGSALPGHGGVLDRFDAVLFVLPATYYLLVYLKLFS